MKQYIITEELRDGILLYLTGRPMKEVEVGVNGLRNLPELPESDNTKTKDTEDAKGE